MKTNQLRYWWYIWQKALGEQASISIRVADHVSIVRTVLVLSYLVTNLVIVLGVLRHW